MSKRILILSNTAWYLYNFRLSLMKALRGRGHTLVAAAPEDEYAARLRDAGFPFRSVPMSRKGKNPFEDLFLLCRLWMLIRRERPDVVLTYTPKPNIYGALAARLSGVPVINNVAGLGNVFIRGGLLSTVVEQLYRLALRKSCRVYFQNADDMDLFLQKGLVPKAVSERIPGSGVDIEKFSPRPRSTPSGAFVFMLVARLLWDKGVGEFVAAARMLKERHQKVECHLVGFIDLDNPNGISADQVRDWVEEGVVMYDGASDNIVEDLSKADCVVLPSFYREGVPKVLLEAASMAKPVITTDSIGCRDAVEDGVTGYLCKVRDVRDLFDKMERIVLMPEPERVQMGARGREKMMKEFNEKFVIERYTEVIEGLPSH